ncbi:hypothetical protein J2S43_001094 [Catenuloplanes nepalensis]|uniref:Glutamyl-tRNA amidotransferase n=1 Tax=Catenuloplanes nepalensis TaxID=587533 RepID=A0ABT9MME2_9ACTN|nr:hypothetical protein [Catenuloplanes nepalensis]MDP9792582.1 hypothetical protein [Catenuloplanes nepalensis]
MASKTTNHAAATLQEIRQREDAAAHAVAVRARAVQRAAQRRRELLGDLDEKVAAAETDLLVALAGLAGLLRDDAVAAMVANVDVTQVKAAHRRVSGEAVAEFVKSLADGPARRGRRTGSTESDARSGIAAGFASGDADPDGEVPSGSLSSGPVDVGR